MDNPLICVVIAVKNGGASIGQAIESFESQTLLSKELVIVDGGSTDQTLDIIESKRHAVERVVSGKDSGIYEAMNKGVNLGRAEWIYFLGADDQLATPTVFEEVAHRLRGLERSILVAYGQVDLTSATGKPLSRVGDPWSESIERKFRYGMPLCHQGIFHRRSLFYSHGGFDQSLQIAADHELILRSLAHAKPHFLGNIVIASMCCSGITGSGKHSVRLLCEIEKSCAKNGIPANTYRLIIAKTRVFLRLLIQKCLGQSLGNTLVDILRHLNGKPKYWTQK